MRCIWDAMRHLPGTLFGGTPAFSAIDPRRLYFWPRFCNFSVGTLIVAQSVHCCNGKKLLGDVLYRLLLKPRHCPANPVEAGEIFGLWLFNTEVSVEQHRISAMLGQRKVCGI